MKTRARHIPRLIVATCLAGWGLMCGGSLLAQDLPRPEPEFRGKIGRTAKDSKPDFPKGVEAPPGAPNVLLILTDDVVVWSDQHVWRAD